jgi:outer membrane immunogenic protein
MSAFRTAAILIPSDWETTLKDIHIKLQYRKYSFYLHTAAAQPAAITLAPPLAEVQDSKRVEGSMMRGIVALAFAAALGSSATAADMPLKAPPAPPAPVYLWTGCYIGGNIGWAEVSTHFEDHFTGEDDGRLSKSGFAGGGQIGCDYQFANNWVFGIQGMIDGTDISRSRFSVLSPEFMFHSDVRWFGTVTGRLGYLITPSFLFYAKGGWGTVKQRFSVTDTLDGFVFRSVDTNAGGGDVGVGFEYMFIPNWTFWVEWDHIFLNNRSIDVRGINTVLFTDNIHRDFDKVLFGINWRFNGYGGYGAPVAARY